MNYDHEGMVADFARRTLHNLKLIREIRATQPEQDAFEVTQLVNSMLGLLVLPKERYLDRIPAKRIEELKSEGWPIPDVPPEYTQAQDLKGLVRLMRNAVAHFNIEFVPNQKNEIVGIKIWNTSVGQPNKKTWEARLSLEEVEAISLRFIALLTGEEGKQMDTQEMAPQSTPITWQRAFIRSGFRFTEENGRFSFSGENAQTEEFLRLLLVELQQIRSYKGRVFSPTVAAVDELAWLAAVEKLHTRSEAGSANLHNLDLRILDTYMAGIVRWVNSAGIKTTFSCDGHQSREPRITLADRSQEPLLRYFLHAASDGKWHFAGSRLFKQSQRAVGPEDEVTDYDRSWLLDIAESLHQHQAMLARFVASAKDLASATRGESSGLTST